MADLKAQLVQVKEDYEAKSRALDHLDSEFEVNQEAAVNRINGLEAEVFAGDRRISELESRAQAFETERDEYKCKLALALSEVDSLKRDLQDRDQKLAALSKANVIGEGESPTVLPAQVILPTDQPAEAIPGPGSGSAVAPTPESTATVGEKSDSCQ